MAQGKHTRPTLSVSMIVKNEEKFLAECLESIREVADEIVIVDTGSTDRTTEIAERFGARVFQFAWVGDFSAARNFSLQHCTSHWVLYIDADERLTAESSRLLPKLMTNPQADAYTVMIENPQSMKQGRFHQHNTYPRLFRRADGVQFEGKVHEQLAPSLLRLKKRVLPSPLTILHVGYDQGYEVVRQKAERNLSLLERQVAENPTDAYVLFQIGNSLVVLERHAEAKPVLERAAACPALDSSNRAVCYNLLAEVAVRSRSLNEAVGYCLKSLDLAPTQFMARWFLSLIYFDLREYDKALVVLNELHRRVSHAPTGRSDEVASDLHLTEADVYKRLAVTYEASCRFDEALEHYLHVLEDMPDADDVAQGIVRCIERNGDARRAVEKLTVAEKLSPHRPEFYLPLAVHHRKLQNNEAAFGFLHRALASQPANPDLYVLAIRWYLESGAVEEAHRMCVIAEEKSLSAFELHRAALQVCLVRGDIHAAFRQLEMMAETTDADLTPLRSRLNALARKLSSASPA